MNQNSISLRHTLYFKMLARLDLLWNQDFQENVELSKENKEILDKLYTTLQELLLLARLPLH